jgi:hypothetical protein
MGGMHPLVSVIIPNYNHAHYVGEAISSVLRQDYPHYEIIVVDDGSTDDSHEVLSAFGGKIRCIHQENRGLSAARNTGILASRGELIGVLDADDIYECDYLKTQVLLLQTSSGADGIYCGYRFIDRENNLLTQSEARFVPPDKLYERLLDGCFLVPESVLVWRRCYEEAGLFDESLKSCEDWDVWLRFARKYRIICTNRLLTRHRILPGSMSTVTDRMLNSRLAVLSKHVGTEPSEPGGNNIAGRRAYGRAYLGSCVEGLQGGNRSHASHCFRKMAMICPTLLTELDTFYQMGCGDQPKGSVGHLASLNLANNSLTLLSMLDDFFAGKAVREDRRYRRRTTYAYAYFALGMLGYGTNHFSTARQFFSRALRMDPRMLWSRQFSLLFLKSLLGRNLAGHLKAFKGRIFSWLQ